MCVAWISEIDWRPCGPMSNMMDLRCIGFDMLTSMLLRIFWPDYDIVSQRGCNSVDFPDFLLRCAALLNFGRFSSGGKKVFQETQPFCSHLLLRFMLLALPSFFPRDHGPMLLGLVSFLLSCPLLSVRHILISLRGVNVT